MTCHLQGICLICLRFDKIEKVLDSVWETVGAPMHDVEIVEMAGNYEKRVANHFMLQPPSLSANCFNITQLRFKNATETSAAWIN